MITHLKIFLSIVGKVALYTIIPGIFYGIIVVIASLFEMQYFSDSATTLIIDYLTLLTVILVFRYYSPDVWNAVFHAKNQLKKFLQLIPISLLTRIPLLIAVIILYLFIGDRITQELEAGVEFQWSVFDKTTFTTAMMGFLSFVIIGPIHEELFYRGIIQRYLGKKYSARTSIIYASTIFAIIHIHPGLIFSSFFLGLFIGYIYHKWDNLWYSIFLHMLINLQPFILQVISNK